MIIHGPKSIITKGDFTHSINYLAQKVVLLKLKKKIF